jgi:DNA polymerase-4
VGAEDTFAVDIFELETALGELERLVAKVWRHCEAKHLHGRTVTVKVKYADFQQITRSRTVAVPPESASEIGTICGTLLGQVFPTRKGIRLLGVTLSSFDEGALKQDGQLRLQL